jgi:hypothetical protein
MPYKMNRLEYIDHLTKKHYLEYDDSSVIYSLIMALKPKEACDFLDLSFIQDYKIRQWILRKIARDIDREFLSFHLDLVDELIEKVSAKPFPKRNSCAFAIDTIFDSLSIRKREEILLTFLNSHYVAVRNRAYKRLGQTWDESYMNRIQSNWEKYHDEYCIKIITEYFPVEMLFANYCEYIEYFKPFQLSRLFLRLNEKDPNKINELRELDEISFVYVLTKLNRYISIKEAKLILKENFKDDRIGLLIWCYGQMGLWDVIVEFEENYKGKIK